MATSPLKNLKETFESAIGAVLAEHGFVRRPSKQSFERKSNDVVSVVHVSYADDRSKSSTSATIDVAVRHGRVEELAALATGASPGEGLQTSTLGTRLGQGPPGVPTRFEVNAETVKQSAPEAASQLIREVGLTYLTEHSDLTKVLQRFESDNFKDWHQLAGGRAVRYPAVLLVLGRVPEAANVLRRMPATLGPQDEPTARIYPAYAARLSERFNFPNPFGP